MSFLSELKRRNVFRVAAAYVVMGWLLIEVSATLEETLRLPEWADTLLAFFLILGLPVVLFFSWAYEITPEGVKREADLHESAEDRAVTGRKLDRVVMVLMAVALAYFAVNQFVLSPRDKPGTSRTAEEVAVQGEAPTAADAAGAPATDDPSAVAAEAAAAAADVPALSIAVLPFVNMSSDQEQEYFADGLTEELLNLLARIEQLKVAARTSSFFYKDKLTEIPFREIGRQLEVAHLLEGSVRRGGDRIRITAQLIKADDGFHLWSETWDRTLDDVFAIQDEIAAAVAEQLKITLLGEAPHARVVDTRSWELTQQARFFFNRRDPGDIGRAFERYREAVEIDPGNADAWAEISPLYRWNFDPPDAENAYGAAAKALELDPDNAVAHARIAPLVWWKGDEEGAEYHMLRALDLGREHPTVLGIWSGWSSMHGEYDNEIRFYEKALSVDPLHRINLGNLANAYVWAGRFEDAGRTMDRYAEIDDSDQLTKMRAELLLLAGRPEEALEMLAGTERERKARRATGTPYIGDLVQLVARHRTGRLEDAGAELAAFAERHGEGSLGLAMAQASLGEVDGAFATLKRAYGESDVVYGQGLNVPYLDPLRGDPRWAALMARVPDMPEEMKALVEEVLSE